MSQVDITGEEDKLPRLPAYSLKKVLNIRGLLARDRRTTQLVGQTLEVKDVARLSRHLAEVMPGNLERQPLRDTLYWLHGVTVTPEHLQKLFDQLSRGFYELKAGRMVDPDGEVQGDQWMIVRVTDVYLAYNRFKKSTYWAVEMRVVVGPALSRTFIQPWSSQKAGFFSREFGFDRKDHPYLHVRQLGRLFVYALFRAGDSEAGKLKPSTFKGTASLVRLNRDLMQMRSRVSFRCPYSLNIYCHNCSMEASDCPAAPCDAGKRREIECSVCHEQVKVTTTVLRNVCNRCFFNFMRDNQ